MPSFNRVTLMGNLTRDPQLKQLPSNTTVAEFGLAMSRRFKTQAGEDREEVCFVDCTAFGRQAEVIGQYCTKGKPLFVEGRLKYDQWDDKTSGLRRNKLTVVVENFQFVGGPQDGQQSSSNRHSGTFDDVRREQPAAPSKSKKATKSRGEERSFTEADIPF